MVEDVYAAAQQAGKTVRPRGPDVVLSRSMAKRYIGDAVITIAYHDSGDYRGSIKAGRYTWAFRDLHAPRAGHGAGIGYDSPEAYDSMAASAVGFGSYYTRGNRGSDTPDWAPRAEVADAISEATSWAQDDQGSYAVARSPKGATRWMS